MHAPLVAAGIWLSAIAADWPQFRGPGGQGHSDEVDLPVVWSDSENVAWRTAIPGRGWSSPVIAGGRIWLTTATEEDRSLRALRLNAADGCLEREVEVFRLEAAPRVHPKNTPASPTAILDGDRVYVHFGKLGTACLSIEGEVLWRKNDLEFEHGHGPGGSPVLYRDLLIFNCDGTDRQFVAALEKDTGEVRWLSPRAGAMAYSTPLLIEVDGEPQLVSPCGERVIAYDPGEGREIWSYRYPGGYSVVVRPVFGQGLVFVSSGYDTAVLHAIRPEGGGDVTETHRAWKLERGAPLNPSPVLIGSDLYVLSDGGALSCVDAGSGEVRWRQRLPGDYSASPVAAAGRIYLLNEEGLATVLEPGDSYRELAVNLVEGRTLASLAIADGAIYLRTDSHLIRIGK
jgi:outer membrane protein assembly factor BamB